MIVIVAEKPSVGRDIARVLGCTQRGEGCLAGGGYVWVGYGVLITVIPILVMGILGRLVFKLNYFALMGTLAGSMTNPIALSFVTTGSPNDIPAVSYSTVYPLTMFLRVVSAQILILAAL